MVTVISRFISYPSFQQIESATTGLDVCIKIENIGGDAPKLYGRHFDENDVLVSKVLFNLLLNF